MEEHFIKNLIKQLPLAYALQKILLDDEGRPADYLFIDVNKEFAQLMMLPMQDIILHRVKELLPDRVQKEFDWVKFFGRVALTGEKSECVQYYKPKNEWYKVIAYSPRKGYFVSVYLNITSEMASMRLLEKQKKEIGSLSSDLEIIFNSTQDSMFLVDFDGSDYRYMRCNRSFLQTTGYSDDILGRNPVELFGPKNGQFLYGKYRECFETGHNMSYEIELSFPAGRQTWLTSLNPVSLEGKVQYLVGASKNITDYKKLEKEKETLLERLDSTFSQHLTPMLIVEPKTSRILDANPAACSFYGYSRDEFITMTLRDINDTHDEQMTKLRPLGPGHTQGYALSPHKLKNGQIRMVDCYSSLITIDNEQVAFSIIHDVTDRESMKKELSREKELLRITLNSIGDGTVTTDIDGVITAINQAAQEITGWCAQETIGKNFKEVFRLKSELTGQTVENPITKVLQSGKVVGLANHTVLINKNEIPVPIADSAAPIRDANGHTFGVVMVFRDVSSEKEQKEQILYLSYHDALTGLYNRRFVEEEMKRADVSSSLPLTVIMGDVNGLKITNDVFGHEAGDRLLQKVAESMNESCRDDDILCRWGGDEFLILMPHTTNNQAEEMISEIKRRCAEKNEGSLQLSVSLGYAVMQSGSESLSQILQDAEEWMYHQKLLEGKSYRNTVINTLLATLYEKSLETEEHAQRLRENCCKMAEQLHLTDKEMNELSLFALLHDIGKVGVNQSILLKPAPLSLEEWEEMRKHPEIGYRIAQNTPELSVVSEYILSHHERWDGGGYPSGLKGEQIPLMCRILAVADAYDAMTNDRAYRRAKSKQDALEEIRRNAGTQFDPKVAEIFLRLMSEPDGQG